ncbi:MAG: ATP-binding protein, partial [Bdellovibrionaceae bacterium]|nr:ATP-binding protein [Pseudobdellovibrionaceae bacterium]
YEKYEPVKSEIQGIVATDDDATDFFIARLTSLFAGIPAVFLGAEDPLQTKILEQSDIRHLTIHARARYRETVELVRRLHPQAKRFVVLADTSVTGVKQLANFKKSLSTDIPELVVLQDGSFEEIARQLESLQPGDILFRLRFYQDALGATMGFHQSLRFLREHTSVPIYTLWQGFIGHGVVGGKMISGDHFGRAAVQALFRLTRNPSFQIDDANVIDEGRYVFDYIQLQRFGVDMDDLPENSVVINRTLSFYEQHKSLAWSIFGIISLLGLVVLGLLRVNAHLRTVRRDLWVAKTKAEEANEIKTRFLANMSHEIRTPLGALLGFAELLNGDSLSASQREDSIGKIQRNGAILSNLVNDILDLSRVESGKLQVEKTEVSIREALNDVIFVAKRKAENKALDIRIRSRGSIPEVITTDPTRLRQILMNIVGNAVKFTEQGTIEIVLQVETRATEQNSIPQLRIDVIDTGRGISPQEADRLFEPFRQADSSMTRKYGGTGLGLALSRDLARFLGGDVRLVRSEVGGGCQFSITIDAGATHGEFTIQDASSLEGPMARPEASVVLPKIKDVRVLLAEDSPDNQAIVSHFLKMAGANVEIANDGIEAIDKALHSSFDVVLMDIQMPRLDGIGATIQLRSLGYRTPIIALTAHALKDQRERSIRAGCNEHLTKPISRRALLETIARFTRTRVPSLDRVPEVAATPMA